MDRLCEFHRHLHCRLYYAVYRPETRQEESHRTFIDRCPTKSNVPELTLFPTVGELERAQDARHEVDLQGGAPLREEEGGGRENQVRKSLAST